MEALARLQEYVAGVERRRVPLEAPLALTSAYLALIFGYAWARLGDHDKGRKAIATAHTLLAAPDPVHEYLVAAFTARIEDAITGRSETAPFTESVTKRLSGLDRVARYKADRMRDSSRILEPYDCEGVATDTWITKRNIAPPSEPPPNSIYALRANPVTTTNEPVIVATCDAIRGRWDLAQPVLDQHRELLSGTNMAMPDRLERIRSLAEAYGEAPLPDGVAGIENLADMFPQITDSYGTNSHFCVSVIGFVDPLVLALVRLAAVRTGH